MQEVTFDTVQAFNDHYGFETFHPLVSVVRFDRERQMEECIVRYGLYALFLKENKGCQLSYGRTKYDLLNDSTLSISQVSQSLGFEYPQHFVRFFKAHTGSTPARFRDAV